MGDQVRWEIPVFDAVQLRPRVLVVEVTETRVVVMPPPGEVLMGEGSRWAELADLLGAAARACRGQVVIDLDDAGDSGGR